MEGSGVAEEGSGQTMVGRASPSLPLAERYVLVAKHA
jgi:hypothetical protein